MECKPFDPRDGSTDTIIFAVIIGALIVLAVILFSLIAMVYEVLQNP